VLRPTGFLVVAVPGADDLLELREAVQGAAIERERVTTLLAEHENLFSVVSRSQARQQLHLPREALLQLLHGTYRGRRGGEAERVASLDAMTITLSSDIVVLTPRQHPPSATPGSVRREGAHRH
jgi:hypothetical protein